VLPVGTDPDRGAGLLRLSGNACAVQPGAIIGSGSSTNLQRGWHVGTVVKIFEPLAWQRMDDYFA
jgi:hypothetical protein